MDCLLDNRVFKCLDLVNNDKTEFLSILFLYDKYIKEECISAFKTFINYGSGELVRSFEKQGIGNILYIGSLRSEVYFCIYEKD